MASDTLFGMVVMGGAGQVRRMTGSHVNDKRLARWEGRLVLEIELEAKWPPHGSGSRC